MDSDKAELVTDAAEEQQQPQQQLQQKLHNSCCPPRGITLIVLISAVFSAIITLALILSIVFGQGQVARIGSVAADASPVSACGLAMLQAGGSAVDAAVAGALCSCVAQYHLTGVGGGGLMLVHNHRTDRTELFDFRSTAPEAARPSMFAGNREAALYSGLAVAVPGFMRGLSEAHARFGKLPWHWLFGPAIKLAEGGFAVNADLHRAVQLNLNRIKANPVLAKAYLDPASQTPLSVNSVIKRPDLLPLLKQLRGSPGAKELYSGGLGDEIVQAVRAKSGQLEKSDLAKYTVTQPQAITGHYRNYTIRTFPTPSIGGVIVLLAANVLSGFNSSVTASQAPGLWYHRLAESLKFAHAATAAALGDSPKGQQMQQIFVGPQFAASVRAQISDQGVYSNFSAAYGKYRPAGVNGTAQLTAVDNDELYVSMATSLNAPFGSLITTSGGILLNNEMAEFADPTVAGANANNLAGPGKRPLTQMAPAFVFNPRARCGLRFALGASNNTRMPDATLNVLLQLTDLASSSSSSGGSCHRVLSQKRDERQPCLPVTAAVDKPRIMADMSGVNPVVGYDAGAKFALPMPVVNQLVAKGHRLQPASDGVGRVQVVAMDMYSLIGYSDFLRAAATAASMGV